MTHHCSMSAGSSRVRNYGSDNVSVFRVDEATGVLTSVATVTVGRLPAGVAMTNY